ncbi:MAG: proline-rich domain-containing protein [Candidatus Staskawiczbacteria bacterium]|nr:proline-rich domain-containing protein [Candidatus Staskawiczbacteria bacterium]
MKKIYLFTILLLASVFFAGSVLAITEPTYPIADLGNCKDKNDCMDFCNNADNMSVCVDYGQKSGMLSAEEASISKKVAEKIKAGTMPGGCKTEVECESFCQGNVTNLEQCLSTAQDLGISSASIDEGKKVLEALKAGAQMPGGCKTKSDCESYCSDPQHIDDCLSFAEKAQLIPAQDLAEARKVAPFLKSGQTPGGCKTKDECNTYCADASHSDACINFAETAGFISKDEAVMARKSGGTGPGGCKSKDACDKYCQDQSHMQECIDFGVKVGAIKQEDVQKIKEGAKMIKDGLGKIPPGAKSSAESCLNDVFGGKLQDVLDNKVQITKDQGDKIGPCFENSIKDFVKGQMPSAGRGGQGGGNIPEGVQGPPSNVQGPPSGVQGPPSGVQGPPSGQQGPPSGTQGPPCSSAEECARMFGPQR